MDKRTWIWVALLPLLAFVSATMCVWSAPRWLGFVSRMLLDGSVFLFSLTCIAVPAALLYAATACFNRSAETSGVLAQRALAGVVLAQLMFLAFVMGNRWRHEAFVRAEVRGNTVTAALAKYRSDHGVYPAALDELVPDYLPEIPFTGLIGYPNFEYDKDQSPRRPVPGSYELRIFCPSGGINFDRFIYWPSETYPGLIDGNGVERIGTWAYIHE